MRKSLLLSLFTLATILAVQSCSKEKSLETGSGGTPATGALIKDSNDLCLPPKIYGIYDTGKALNDSNYVILSVNVTKPGFYRIQSDEQNGFSFADSGFFNVVGQKLVKLKATGTPILNNTTDFLINFDSSVCGFSIHVTANESGGSTDPNQSDTAWRFSDGTSTFSGKVETAFFWTRPDLNSVNRHYFSISGPVSQSPEKSIDLTFEIPTAEAIPAMSYASNTNFRFDVYVGDITTGNTTSFYLAGPGQASPSNTLQAEVAYYNETTHIVEGTFSGTASVMSADGTTVTGTVNIQGGKFKAKIDPE